MTPIDTYFFYSIKIPLETPKIKMFDVVLKSKCGAAKLSLPLFVLFSCYSRYVAFVELIDLNVLLV